MALELPYGILVLNPTPLDAKYSNNGTPYTSVSAANTAIDAAVRYRGLTVNVSGIEYWYKDGTADGNLVVKQSGSVGSGTKASGVDAGILGELSIDDDYLYICTTGGAIGVAVWKKIALTQT